MARSACLRNFAVHVAIQRRALSRDHAKIGQAVVIEIAGRDEYSRRAALRGQSLALSYSVQKQSNAAADHAIRLGRAPPSRAIAATPGVPKSRPVIRRFYKVAVPAVAGEALDRVVDLGVVAPLHVFRNSSAFLLLFDFLKDAQLSGGPLAVSVGGTDRRVGSAVRPVADSGGVLSRTP